MDFFGQYGGERLKTAEFCKRMVEFELLSGQEVKRTVRGEKQNLAGYVAVDARKLENLDAQQLWELHRSGLLAVIYGSCIVPEPGRYRSGERRQRHRNHQRRRAIARVSEMLQNRNAGTSPDRID
jgi:hypothetical protein